MEYQEALARVELVGKGFPVFMPTMLEDGATVAQPLFPQYMFVQKCDIAWQDAHHTRGVNYLLGCTSRRGDPTVGTHPYIVPARVMRELLERCDTKQQIILSPAAVPVVEPLVAMREEVPVLELSAGDRVRIVSGPFKDFEAMVKMSKRQRVDVLLSVMGSEQQVRVPVRSLARVM